MKAQWVLAPRFLIKYFNQMFTILDLESYFQKIEIIQIQGKSYA